MSPDEEVVFPEGAAADLLRQAREKAIVLLNRLLSEQAQVEWDAAKVKGDEQAEADWRQAMICAIESAKRAVAAIDAAIKVAPDDAAETPIADDHRWN